MPCKKAGEPPEKRKKKDQNHYYPALGSCEEDEESYSRNIALLQKELQNKRPNSSAIKSLMVRTFSERRKEVLDGGKMVSTLCEEYPFLKRETYVSNGNIPSMMLCICVYYLYAVGTRDGLRHTEG